VAAPYFQPDKASFTISATLVIKCDTPGAIVYYTADGRDPDATSLFVMDDGSILWTKIG
jgi:hypothetical protein